MPSSLKIGEVARRAGVAAKDIRFYERSGVLPPACSRWQWVPPLREGCRRDARVRQTGRGPWPHSGRAQGHHHHPARRAATVRARAPAADREGARARPETERPPRGAPAGAPKLVRLDARALEAGCRMPAHRGPDPSGRVQAGQREIVVALRKRRRCYRSTVAGATMRKACLHAGHTLASQTPKSRSRCRSFGRFAVRWYTASCWRNARFSRASWRYPP